MTGLEIGAVVFALLYLIFAVHQNIWCWPCAMVSSVLFFVLVYQQGLLSQSLLQIFYMVMALYGWYQWRFGGDQQDSLPVSTWSLKRHGLLLIVTVLGCLTLGSVFASNPNVALPYEDALVTSGAVVATFLTAKKVLENWYYWFVIDSISVHLYASQALYLTALLFVVYLILIVIGFMSWRKDLTGGRDAA